ncbi:uncharacterized protein A1O5_08326 [Cladophialophora psammophila CBS 110553]|uniref:Transcription factor domain-containing protein n=1 Tax=Cladophialophora psammophila CBS 110553 TaxID=1182543 RepID=W9WKU9_9EURO|nr:uncharacterized protein A1O5_08326 [Cladophialophora psammophila CBS 110553]EXJ68533.1 hypothetical protein A1O5_08326 [Cladophialophora psammophila CBS 110553]
MEEAAITSVATTGKKRIPNLKKVCVYVEKPPDPHEQKIEALEKEVQLLKQRLDSQKQNDLYATFSTVDATASTASAFGSPEQVASLVRTGSDMQSNPGDPRRKRTRSQLEVEVASVPNFAAKGLITFDQAELFFNAFFQGCDRYVPIFDPLNDTFESISSRSALLFDAIITIGCGVLSDADSQICHLLNFHLKKMLNLVIVSPEHASLETVQALLVTACYTSERSLLLAFATRMALDLGLPDAYEDLTRKIVSRGSLSQNRDSQKYDEADAVLMRRARAWFQLMVLEQILRVDAGNLRSFHSRGDPRRCRILLNKPFTTILDLRLLSQVELNSLRGRTHDSIAGTEQFDEEAVLDILRDVQVDIDVWYSDWKNIMQGSSSVETPVLLLNLEVQKYWSQTVALCRALRALGNENIAAMSSTQRDILHMAKDALKGHLRIILDQPQHYLSKFCYAMDFVWAKCAFCFLLLLKLTRLLPEEDDHSKRQLLDDGYMLLNELNKAGGGWTSGGRSNTSRLYLQVLQQSIQKYGRALQNDGSGPAHSDINQADIGQDPRSPLNFFWTTGGSAATNEIETFVPEQFVFEWDFPGLTLFSSPAMGDTFFDEFLIGNGASDPLFFGMLS